ncbi:MAG: serine/threonine-protein kinase, partial [Phycisphaerales bacterium]|nr:serine/threonine-protein kinase [Phycisphaerales bacterium]
MTMNPWDRIKTLFNEAVELEPDQRADFLDALPEADKPLRPRLEELLAVEADRPFSTTVTDGVGPEVGSVIGPYKILELIGEGGFGLVYMAEQQGELRRRVALKILKPGLDSRQVLGRFHAERQALAMMDHPGIARIFEAGSTEDGYPYFAMELVRGEPITAYCDRHKLSLRERIDLFREVCEAVQHAHMKGVIHRDLKPSNVLVTSHDGRPVPKVIDFGIAKAMGQQLTDLTLFTGLRQFLGTPAYMAPEQAELSGLDVDTRSDVYSLGALLYELLCGRPVFDRETLVNAGLDEVRRLIQEEEPARVSVRFSTSGDVNAIAERHQSSPAAMNRMLRGELDWITAKAMEKDRRRRYESASDFSTDLRRYLEGDAVEASPPSLVYRSHKFVRRNKAFTFVFGCLAVVLLMIVGLLIYKTNLDERMTQAFESFQEVMTDQSKVFLHIDSTDIVEEHTKSILIQHSSSELVDNILNKEDSSLYIQVGDTWSGRLFNSHKITMDKLKEKGRSLPPLFQASYEAKNWRNNHIILASLVAKGHAFELKDVILKWKETSKSYFEAKRELLISARDSIAGLKRFSRDFDNDLGELNLDEY